MRRFAAAGSATVEAAVSNGIGLPWATSVDQIKVTKIPGTNQTETINSTNTFTILSTQARASTSVAAQYAVGAKWRVSPANVRAIHKSLFDGTLQGIELTDKSAFSFQGHPEASPGPSDFARCSSSISSASSSPW